MPQINRIRVNNVKYNFGTQFYDDFVMRFSCRNSIYDLANGGGKSVLMLLLLQNLIPNCTLDDKQPVEKLFRSGNVNSTIHSLVEWKLDSPSMRNGFKYMTTGFCARKGRDHGEDTDRGSDTANIEYFNYCIFYREAGENDIKNLPLENGKERITYNGLKTYLRDLERRDFGVEVHVFDRKGDYQNYISGYGLYESQWEIIRGINKTEGHVRTYFENNYKTTRKVIEDLLIEEIIEKSYNNRIRKNQSDEEEMAKTLLDIKDKLIELTKRKGEIHSYDRQRELLSDFSQRVLVFQNIYEEKDKIQKELLSCLLACRQIMQHRNGQLEAMETELAELEEAYAREEQLVARGELEVELLQLEQLETLIQETAHKRELLAENRQNIVQEIALKETAGDYWDYLEYRKKHQELWELMHNKTTDRSQLLEEMQRLAATKLFQNQGQIQELESRIQKTHDVLEEIVSTHTRYQQESMEAFGRIKTMEGLKKESVQETATIQDELEQLMSQCNLLVAENGYQQFQATTEKLDQAQRTLEELENLLGKTTEHLMLVKQQISQTDAGLSLSGEEIDRVTERMEAGREQELHLNALKKVYGESLLESLMRTMETLHENLTRDYVLKKTEVEAGERYLEAVKNATLPEYDLNYQILLDYLQGRYQGDIRTGKEVLEHLSPEEASHAMELFPMLPFCIFAKESFEEIRQDKALRMLNTGSYVIPILRWDVFETGKYPYPGEDWIVAYKNMEFLWDESGRMAELGKITEDLGKINHEMHRCEDRRSMIGKDLAFVQTYDESQAPDQMQKHLHRLRQDHQELDARKEQLILEQEDARLRMQQYRDALMNEKNSILRLQKEYGYLEKIIQLNENLNHRYQKQKEYDTTLLVDKKTYANSQIKINGMEEEQRKNQQILEAAQKKLLDINQEFAAHYQQFYQEGIPAYEGLSEEEVDAKAGALRQIISSQMGDLSDKEKLLSTYSASMQKCEDAIKYRGMSLAEAKEAYEEGRLVKVSMDALFALRHQLDGLDAELREIDRGLDSERGHQNRVEGGIAHAKSIYQEKFGVFERLSLNQPQDFISSHRQEMSAVKTQTLEKQKEMKALDHSGKEIQLMEKDLERIIRNANLEIPELDIDVSMELQTVSVAAYEDAQKRYERLQKNEVRRKEEFLQQKQKLVDALLGTQAYELAEEIRVSIQIPNTVSEVLQMVEGIHETNQCILLERDSIERGISDMERIKDSFENRCVQICSNIKTELDRLSKLSRITLDQEIISIITLTIPYIKEDMYMDRMSVYINETVSGAETFSGQEDKLKYIKNRLSWKKLFSVIVTDMNSIRLSLYKREHMKDQSRYLKYEEAVGSTGQSQGIYIQFLIAIINYISSLNATGTDGAVIGKSIFIDNPFGAAKDVYIWEPIFKLLKTNHVQLIVPARGATPAITKMFDVNYILGQKMTQGKQQTVVVDYRSQMQMEELEYENLEYEQATLNLD